MKTKKAISLIVLVITIIVMIILASAVIITLSNTGIIGKAQEAVDKTNMAQIKEDAEMIKWDLKLTNSKLTQAELVTKLNEHFEQSTVAGNVITTGKYDITVGEDLTITVGKHQGSTDPDEPGEPDDPETPIYFGDIYVADVEMTMDGMNINKVGIVVYENSAAEMYYAIEEFGDTLFCVAAFEGAVIEDDKITLAEEEATIVDKETVSLNFGDDTIIFTHSDQEVHGFYRGYTYTYSGIINEGTVFEETFNIEFSISTNNSVTFVVNGQGRPTTPVVSHDGDHYFESYDESTGGYIPVVFTSADGRSALVGDMGVILTLDETTAPEESIWEAYDIYDAVANVDNDILNEFGLDKNYHILTNIKVQSIYKQYTLQEYKDQYIVNALMETQVPNLSLDDLIIGSLGASMGLDYITGYVTMDDVVDYLNKSFGVTFARDQWVYSWVLNIGTDVDTTLQALGYDPSEIEAEYATLQQTEIPTELTSKTYTITYPDNTQQTVAGSNLGTYVGRYIVDENVIYNIGISDGTTQTSVSVNISELIPATYEDDYYTYTYNSDKRYLGYSVVAKDKTLSTYGAILTEIQGVPIVEMRATFKDCENLITSPNIPDTVKSLSLAFYRCKKLTAAPNIPSSVTDMSMTFYDCTNLTTVSNIPNNVIDLASTFYGCSSLISLPAVPASVSMLAYAFYDCKKLEGVLYINSTALDSTWDDEGQNALYGNTGIYGSGLTVVVPNDTVRQLLIDNSGYDSEHVTIVKELAG